MWSWTLVGTVAYLKNSESSKTLFDKIHVKNWISNLYILLKSALKMQEMPFQRPKISKWDFKTIYFAQKCPQNAGNAVSETQISKKNFRGGMPPDPPKIVSSLWPPPH